MSADSFLSLVPVYEEGLEGAPGRLEVESKSLRLQWTDETEEESVSGLLQRAESLEFPFI